MHARIIAYLKANKVLSITWGVMVVVGIFAFFNAVHPKFTLPKINFPKAKTQVVKVAPNDPNAQIQKQNASIVAAAAKQIALPTDEEPVFATVSDKDKLQNQDFFKQAQNGDKILLYKKNQKAFLYRPSTEQVIAQAPLEYDDASGTASVAGVTAAPRDPNAPIPTIKPNGKVLYNNQ